jgi:hypothetical protein
MKNYKENDTLVPLEFLDNDGTLLSIAILYFAMTQPTCIVRGGFITDEGRERYTSLTLLHNFLIAASDIIYMVTSKCSEVFWLQRTARARQLKNIYNSMVHNPINKYEIRIAEEIPSYTKSNNNLFSKYLLGAMDGKCPKSLSIVNLYKID